MDEGWGSELAPLLLLLFPSEEEEEKRRSRGRRRRSIRMRRAIDFDGSEGKGFRVEEEEG